MGRRFPDGGLLRYRKWVPQQLGDVADRQPTNGSAAQRHGSQSHRFAVRVWSNLCICSPGLVELVKSNLAPDFPLFHDLRSVKVKTSSSFDPSSIYVQCKLHCTLWHDCGRLDTSFACEVWLKSLISQHKCVMIIIDHTTSFYSF